MQELAFTFANAIEYINTCTSRAGLKVDDFAPRLSFFSAAQWNSVRKLPSLESWLGGIYAKIMKDKFHATSPKSQDTSASTFKHPANHSLHSRSTITLSGSQLKHLLGAWWMLILAYQFLRDEALALPTEESVKIALRTQQIIASETGVSKTVESTGGLILH